MKKLISFISIIFLFSNVNSKTLLPPQLADSLIEVLDNRPTKDSIRAELLNQIGFEIYTTNLDLTKKYADELLELSKEIDYDEGVLKAYNLLGIYFDYKGDYNEALVQYGMSLRKAEQINYLRGVSSGLNNLGTIYEVLGNYPQALYYYQESLKIDLQRNDNYGIANSYINIGNLYENLHDNEKAMNYYQKCLHLSDSLDFDILKAYSLMNIGYVLNVIGDKQEARKFFKNSFEISEDHNQVEGMLLACLMIGILEKEEGNHKLAKEELNKALAASIKMGSVTQERYCYFHLAGVYYNQKNYKRALDLVKLAYVDDEISDENLRMNTAELLSQIYAATKKYDLAYQYHVIFKSLQDHSFNEENIQEISNLEYQYKYENKKKAFELEQEKKDAINKAKHQRQIAIQHSLILISVLLTLLSILILYSLIQRRKANKLLQKQKINLKEANNLLMLQKKEIETVAKELEKANETKDKFFSIIAHDLRSPFTTILGFSNILLESHEEFDKESLETFLSKIKNGSETALILLENLFSWARANSGNIKFSPKSIELEPLVNLVCNLYESGANSKNIELKCLVYPSTQIFADEEMLRTILRNLVSNALKFTKAQGTIEVATKNEESKTVILVKDNGIGMSKNQVNSLFELNKKTVTRGTSGERGTGLGLVLCYEFVNKHKGSILVSSEEGIGTEVRVILPNR